MVRCPSERPASVWWRRVTGMGPGSGPEKSPRSPGGVPYLPYLRPKVWKPESRYWRASSIPSIPSIPLPRARAPARVGACGGARAGARV